MRLRVGDDPSAPGVRGARSISILSDPFTARSDDSGFKRGVFERWREALSSSRSVTRLAFAMDRHRC